ncbi:MAG: TetR/AcrR family transcriptional regulator [Proteobacteria bacterium]|jgi:AcrR family transcriptional regulator|nr:TetR/AcrR family transcriptional regulator [Pseudomonadota bacterium]
MARIVKSATDRQDEILDVALKLFAERGYSNTSVQAIINTIGIAKGTFYHHFSSKDALLDALIQRWIQFSLNLVQPLIDDPNMGAIEKLVGFYQRIGAWKVSQRALMLDVARAMNDDSNALMQKRNTQATLDTFSPLLARIIEQGVQEGSFQTSFPSETAQIVMEVTAALSRKLSTAMSNHQDVSLPELEATLDAQQETIERILGAPAGSISIIDRSHLALWAEAAKEGPQ